MTDYTLHMQWAGVMIRDAEVALRREIIKQMESDTEMSIYGVQKESNDIVVIQCNRMPMRIEHDAIRAVLHEYVLRWDEAQIAKIRAIRPAGRSLRRILAED